MKTIMIVAALFATLTLAACKKDNKLYTPAADCVPTSANYDGEKCENAKK